MDDSTRGTRLSHVRVALQVHGQGDTLSRTDDHHVLFQPLAGSRTTEPRKLYFDNCFDATASADDVHARCNLATLAARAVEGYSSALFIAGLGRKFAQNRVALFEPLVASLEELLAANPKVAVTYAHIAVTDTKCVDLVQDKPVDLAASGGSIRALYQPVADVADLVYKVRQGCSLPYVLSIRFENTEAPSRTVGHLLLADMGLPCFDAATSVEKLQKRGPSLSLSMRTLRTIVNMLTTAGTEGPVPYHQSHFTDLCKDFFGGSGTAVFVLHVDASNDASHEEIAGLVEFAEPLRKLQILERANVVDPRLTEAELVGADWAEAHKEATAEMEQMRSTMSSELEAAQARLVAAEQEFAKDLDARAKEYAQLSQEKEAALRQEHIKQEAIWREDLERVKSEMQRALDVSHSERETAVATIVAEHTAQMEQIKSMTSVKLAETEREHTERQAVFRVQLTRALNDKVDADERARCLRLEALHAEHERYALMLERDDVETSVTQARIRCEELEGRLASSATALSETVNVLDELKAAYAGEQAAKLAAESLSQTTSEALDECRKQASRLQADLDAANVLASNQTLLIEKKTLLLAEGEAALEAKAQQITACETELEETKITLETTRTERDAALAQTEAERTVARGETQALREEIALARSAAEHAETELERIRGDAVTAEKHHHEEMADFQKQMDAYKAAAEQHAREWERNEGRFEGEREGWNRQQTAWDRERERLLEDMQELKLEIARARVSGAGEEDKMKIWFEKIESENRALRDEVAEVKNLRRQRRDSDFESVRMQSRAERLEAENARLAEEVARKEAEWNREKAMLARESEIREREIKAAAAKSLRDEQLAAARRGATEEATKAAWDQSEADVDCPPLKGRAGKASRLKQPEETTVIPMDVDDDQLSEQAAEMPSEPRAPAKQATKRAQTHAPTDESVISTDAERAADVAPVAKRRRQTKAAKALPDAESVANSQEAETAPAAHQQEEPVVEGDVALKKPPRRRAAKKGSVVDAEAEGEGEAATAAAPELDATRQADDAAELTEEDVFNEENHAQRPRRHRNIAGGNREYWVVGAAAPAAESEEAGNKELEAHAAPVRKPRAPRKNAVEVEERINDVAATGDSVPAAINSEEAMEKVAPMKKPRKSRKKAVEVEPAEDAVEALDDAPADPAAEEPEEEPARASRQRRAPRKKVAAVELTLDDAVEPEGEAPVVSDLDEPVEETAPTKRKPRSRKTAVEVEEAADAAVEPDVDAPAGLGGEEPGEEVAFVQRKPRAPRKKVAAEEPPSEGADEPDADSPTASAEEIADQNALAQPKPRKSRMKVAQVDPALEDAVEADDDVPMEPNAEQPRDEVPPAQPKPGRSRKKATKAETTAEDVDEAEPNNDNQGEHEDDETSSAKAPRRKPGRKMNAATVPAQDKIPDVNATENPTAPRKPAAAKGKGRGKAAAAVSASVDPESSSPTDAAPATKAPARKRKSPAVSAPTDTDANPAEPVPPENDAGAENVDPAPPPRADAQPEKPKRRKLNGGRRISLEMVEHPDALGDDDSLTAAATIRPPAAGKSTAADPTTDAASSATVPLTDLGDPSSQSSTSSGGGSSSQKLPQLPNLNANGRVQFKKRPGISQDRLNAILRGYGIPEISGTNKHGGNL
ncbi:hypothetical protein HDU88_001680 [Geranomyces variabilis]|nr:hypothetical protein HDU88_001680 [Geranomyces variabilis]